MIEPARDTDGLRTAFLEMMEAAADAPRLERALRTAQYASNSTRMTEILSPMRSLSAGYYSRADYLFWLRRALDVAPGIWPGALRSDELAGLLTLEDARNEFERSHLRCPGCGALNKRAASRCSCGEELRAKTRK